VTTTWLRLTDTAGQPVLVRLADVSFAKVNSVGKTLLYLGRPGDYVAVQESMEDVCTMIEGAVGVS